MTETARITNGSAGRLRALLQQTPPDSSAIKDAVCAYVDEMKTLGASVERIIVDIKRFVELEDGPLRYAMTRKGTDEHEVAKRIRDDAVRWCIDRFYWTPPTA